MLNSQRLSVLFVFSDKFSRNIPNVEKIVDLKRTEFIIIILVTFYTILLYIHTVCLVEITKTCTEQCESYVSV